MLEGKEAHPRAKLSLPDLLGSVALATAWVALVRPGGIDLPFFWDEADVYVPGAAWVAEHGLSVTPGVFPDDYSRGHPPLLYLVAGAAFAAFGESPAVGHLVVLPFTVAALAGTYLLGTQLFGRRAGAAAALLLGLTPLFMSIGNMLLPEVPLTALAVLSFLALARGRIGISVGLGVAAVWMKETGIFGAAGIGAAVLFDAWRGGALRSRAALSRIALATAPLLALCVFFAWQKATAGYFVYPHHVDLLEGRPFGWSNLGTVFPSILAAHGRWIVSLAALPLALLAARVGSTGATEAPAPSGWRPRTSSMLAGLLVVVLGNAIFFAKMFWLERYALPAHPLVLVAACGALFSLSTVERGRLALILPWAPVLAAAALGALSLGSPGDPRAPEQTFAYADVIATHRAASRAIDGPDPLVLTTWPSSVELRHAYLGYVERDLRALDARYVERPADAELTHVLVDGASERAGELRREARRRGLRRLGTFRVGAAPELELFGP